MSGEGLTKFDRMLQAGARLAAALTGVSAGVFTGDPYIGAGTAWATNEILTIGQEVMGRVTARSAIRTGAALTIIAADAQEHRDQGDHPRTDGFFDERGMLRADAQELLEAILLASANCFEERKLPFMAHMYDGIAYDSTISAGDSLFLVRTVY